MNMARNEPAFENEEVSQIKKLERKQLSKNLDIVNTLQLATEKPSNPSLEMVTNYCKRNLAKLGSQDIIKIISDIYELKLTYKTTALKNRVSIKVV